MENLNALRESLDNIDQAFIFLLAERFRVTQKIGKYKSNYGLPALEEARERTQFEQIGKLAQEKGLNPELIHKMYRLIIDEVIESHQAL